MKRRAPRSPVFRVVVRLFLKLGHTESAEEEHERDDLENDEHRLDSPEGGHAGTDGEERQISLDASRPNSPDSRIGIPRASLRTSATITWFSSAKVGAGREYTGGGPPLGGQAVRGNGCSAACRRDIHEIGRDVECLNVPWVAVFHPFRDERQDDHRHEQHGDP